MSLLLVPIVVPLAAAPVLLLLPEKGRRVFLMCCVSIVALFGLMLLTRIDVGGHVAVFSSAYQQQSGISFLSFGLNPVGKIALFGFTVILSLGVLYGLQVTPAAEQAVALLALAGAAGVALADNYLTFLLFWEVLTLAATALIFLKKTEHAVRMAGRVLFMQLAGGLALSVGIVMNYHATGSFALTVPVAGLPFFIAGIGVKAAFLPLHVWIPWGYPAASFSASVLLAALCTKAGVFAVARILPPSEGVALMGALMAITAASFALVQHDMRRLLSVHIVSQVGYMVAGIGLGNHYGVDGGLLHMANNMFYKALLFMCAGAVLYATGTEDLHRLHHPPAGGEGPSLRRALPVVYLGALTGALAIAGMPLFNGYVSKYLLKKAAYGVYPIEIILLIAGIGTALSFTKFIWFGFIKARAKVLRPPTVTMHLAIVVSAAACLIFGVSPQLAAGLLPHHTGLHVYSWSGVALSLQIIGLALGIFVLTARILERGIHAPGWVNSAARFSMAAARGAATGTVQLFDACVSGVQLLTSEAGSTGYKAVFRVFQRVDYRPGASRFFRLFNVSNMDFDVLLVVIIFGVLAMWYLFMTLEIQIIHTNPF